MTLFDKFKKIWVQEGKKNIPEPKDTGPGEISSYGKHLSLTEDDRRNRIALLTPREHDLYLLLLEGYTLKESTVQLSIKYSTANTHMTSIYKKLNVKSRAELIINYRDMGAKI